MLFQIYHIRVPSSSCFLDLKVEALKKLYVNGWLGDWVKIIDIEAPQCLWF